MIFRLFTKERRAPRNNVGSMVIRNETYAAVAYYTQGTLTQFSQSQCTHRRLPVMGWPNPPGVVRWINLLGVSLAGDNLAIVYLGLPPKAPSSITRYCGALV